MKRSLIIFGLAAGLFTLPSCTKKLKDDVKSLEQQVEELKQKNELLKDRAGTLEKIVGTDEAITATTTYSTENGTPQTFTETYLYKYAGEGTQYAIKQENGTYAITILRLGLSRNEGAYVQFVYDPATKALSNQVTGHVWVSGQDRYMAVRYYQTEGVTGCDAGITVKSFNVETGDISIEASASATAAFTANSDNFPYQGQPYTTKFTFKGKVAVLTDVEP